MTKTELLKIAKPILFNTDMVRAILDGRKTVTRRVIKFPEGMTGRLSESGATDHIFYPGGIKRPLYHTGDILYVRETWNEYLNNENIEYCYLADMQNVTYVDMDDEPIKWKPSIHMPKSAARIFLRITDARVERLRDMKDIDAYKEGITDCKGNKCKGYELCDTLSNHVKKCFSYLWNSTIKKQDLNKYGWDTNPWVWVYEFERINNNENNNN